VQRVRIDELVEGDRIVRWGPSFFKTREQDEEEIELHLQESNAGVFRVVGVKERPFGAADVRVASPLGGEPVLTGTRVLVWKINDNDNNDGED
jgi:hypothetical protein